ncbi:MULTISPECIES: hypothetical protein [unclassified Clostridium]|uniref:hypothetical protein n=1 Tax=unclassified Clostridium TaxID=2614128 RepID=UPI000298653E|nr:MULTISPECIES: hypothetical protein [unclassified Clostridium]EKQ56258.1 MAG: hypothetical protein A370_02014 [Clostridium sp. Maddingley MBC34-26]
MAIFNNMYITNAGQALYTKAQAGQQIQFTKMQVGSGQIGTQNPATLNALVNPQFNVAIQSITANSDLKTATISGSINNNNITQAVYICEIGLFANDPNAGEILYGYASAGTYGDYYAPSTAGPYTWNYEVNAAIGNAANVTAQLSGLTYDYGVINTNTTFNKISGGNQKEINKSIDTFLADLTYQTAGGTATAITLSTQTLVNGYFKTFIASANNNSAATTINGKSLYKPGTTTAPNLIAGKAYTVWYNSTGDCFFIKASAEGDADLTNVLAGKKFSNDNDTGIVGTMPNNGALGGSLDINGTYTIPAGYTTGGTVTQSITTKATATYNPSTTTQTIAAGQYLSGAQTINPVTGTAGAGDVLSGKTFASANGIGLTGTIPSKAGATINPSTSQQTIAAGQYLSGDQVIAPITGTATDADVVSGKTYNSAAGIARTGTATVQSLGGQLYTTGSIAHTNGTANTITLPFTPRVVMLTTSGGTLIWCVGAYYNYGYPISSANATPNNTIVFSGNTITIISSVLTTTYTYYAWS